MCKLYWSSKFNYVKLNYNSSSHSSSILNLVSAGISRSVERFFSNAGKKEEKIGVSRDNAPKHRHVAGDVHRAHPKKVFRNHSPTERRHRVKKRKIVDVWRCWNKTALLVYFIVYSPNIYYPIVTMKKTPHRQLFLCFIFIDFNVIWISLITIINIIKYSFTTMIVKLCIK